MKITRQILLLIMLISLAGCGVNPTQMGISKADWKTFSKTEKQRALADYKYMQILGKNEQSVLGDSWLEVTVQNGRAMMFPFTSRSGYSPVTVTLQEGSCTSAKLQAINSRLFVNLMLCYRHKVLFLDPSRYQIAKADGSLKLYFNPLWQSGFTYKNIVTSGYAQLQNADIAIKLKNVTANVTAKKHK